MLVSPLPDVPPAVVGGPMVGVLGVVEASSGQAVAPDFWRARLRYRLDIDQQRAESRNLISEYILPIHRENTRHVAILAITGRFRAVSQLDVFSPLWMSWLTDLVNAESFRNKNG